jgi:hypothetical protein
MAVSSAAAWADRMAVRWEPRKADSMVDEKVQMWAVK